MRNKFVKVNDPNDFVSDPGSPVHELFSAKVMSDGTIKLVCYGKENIQDKINSFRAMTDMSYILSRMAVGDTSVLTDKVPMYGDFTNVPKSYAEALQMVMDAEKKFVSLPLDVRKEFDMDYRKWLVSAGSEEWMKKMDSIVIKPDKVEGNEEVSSSES